MSLPKYDGGPLNRTGVVPTHGEGVHNEGNTKLSQAPPPNYEEAVRIPQPGISEKGSEILEAALGGVDTLTITEGIINPGLFSDEWMKYVYTIKDSFSGREIIRGEQEVYNYSRSLLGNLRQFEMPLKHVGSGTDTFLIKRSGLRVVEVFSNKELFGSVEQCDELMATLLAVKDKMGTKVFDVGARSILWNFGREEMFRITPVGEDSKVTYGEGYISKPLNCEPVEAFHTIVSFNLAFPPGLQDVRKKALLLASVFVNDFLFFERPGQVHSIPPIQSGPTFVA